MDGGNELAGCQTEDHPRGQVVLSDALAEAEVLVEHFSQTQRDGLDDVSTIIS